MVRMLYHEHMKKLLTTFLQIAHLSLNFASDPWVQMTHLCPSGYYVSITAFCCDHIPDMNRAKDEAMIDTVIGCKPFSVARINHN